MRGSIYNTLTLLLTRQVIAFPVAILVSISLPPRATSVISRFWRPIEAEHWRRCNLDFMVGGQYENAQWSPLSWLSLARGEFCLRGCSAFAWEFG